MHAKLLQQIMSGRSLSRIEARELLETILAGRMDEALMAALLVALAMKGETVEEIVGFAEAMRAAAQPLPLDGATRALLVDTCGTGGDDSGSFNISTAAAFVAAGAGLRVAKHGNRSISSRCGSADVIEALGVNLNLSPEKLALCVREVGITFLFAPHLHMAMRYVQPVRKQLQVRTIFNLLGPLTNPARAGAQVVGVFSAALTHTLAGVLGELGVGRAFVVHGADGLDEFSTTGETLVAELNDGKVRNYRLDARELGLPRARLDELAGGDAYENADHVIEVLQGRPGPKLDIVLLNAAAALVAGGRAEDLPAGLLLAREAAQSGAAYEKMQHLVEFTQTAAAASSH